MVVASTGDGEGEATGELAGDGDGLAFPVACFVFAWCLGEPVALLPAFSSVFPVFFNPLPTVRSVACAPCSTVWPVFVVTFSMVLPVFSTGPGSSALIASGSPSDTTIINAKCLIINSASVRIKPPPAALFARKLTGGTSGNLVCTAGLNVGYLALGE